MSAIAASIALAPFDNLSGDPAQDVLARGFVEDVASALSRFGTLEVMYPRALESAGLLRQGDAAARVNTLLRGSIRRAGDVIRINVQLLEPRGARQVWADRYDVTAHNLFDVQDDIAQRVASAMAINVDRKRLEAAHRAPLNSLDTYDCWSLRLRDSLRSKGSLRSQGLASLEGTRSARRDSLRS